MIYGAFGLNYIHLHEYQWEDAEHSGGSSLQSGPGDTLQGVSELLLAVGEWDAN